MIHSDFSVFFSGMTSVNCMGLSSVKISLSYCLVFIGHRLSLGQSNILGQAGVYLETGIHCVFPDNPLFPP